MLGKHGPVVQQSKWEESFGSISLWYGIQCSPSHSLTDGHETTLGFSNCSKAWEKLFHLNYYVESLMRPKRLLVWGNVSLKYKNITDAKLPNTFEAANYKMNQRREVHMEALGGNVEMVLRQEIKLRDLFKHSACVISVHSLNKSVTPVVLTQFCKWEKWRLKS